MLDIMEILVWAFRQNFHLDHSNAAIHCGTVRYSPLTFRLAEAIQFFNSSADLPPINNERYQDVYTVLLDLGVYEEDKGR